MQPINKAESQKPSAFSFVKELVLPAGFEPAAFHLGGERSILLSYGSRNQLRITIYELRIVVYQRPHVIAIKFLPSAEEIEFDDE